MSKEKSKDKACDYNNFKRSRYFHGMLMTDRDFTEEQLYHNKKRKLLNRYLHGWGVICGLGIEATSPESSKIIITPGMALDPQGNEILVCEDFEVDLRNKPTNCGEIAEADDDPCAHLKKGDSEEFKHYIAIKYNEVHTDPVPVYAPGGGCEEKVCDYSRTRDGFCVKRFKSPPCYPVLPEDGLIEKILECLREKVDSKRILECIVKKMKEFHNSFCKQPYRCPTYCCEGELYVVLGSIDCSKTQGEIKTIEQDMISINDGRRYVMTPGFVQYYLGSFFNPIAEFLDNPFVDVCDSMASIEELCRCFRNTERKIKELREVIGKVRMIIKSKQAPQKK